MCAGFVARVEDTRVPKCVMFGEMVGGAGCVEGAEKRMDRVFSGRPQSFQHQRRPVDDNYCSPGREGNWHRTVEQGAGGFLAKRIAAEKARSGLRYAVAYPNVTERTKERIAQSKQARAGSLAIVD